MSFYKLGKDAIRQRIHSSDAARQRYRRS
jgi:hypothetical protein